MRCKRSARDAGESAEHQEWGEERQSRASFLKRKITHNTLWYLRKWNRFELHRSRSAPAA